MPHLGSWSWLPTDSAFVEGRWRQPCGVHRRTSSFVPHDLAGLSASARLGRVERRHGVDSRRRTQGSLRLTSSDSRRGRDRRGIGGCVEPGRPSKAAWCTPPEQWSNRSSETLVHVESFPVVLPASPVSVREERTLDAGEGVVRLASMGEQVRLNPSGCADHANRAGSYTRSTALGCPRASAYARATPRCGRGRAR